MTTMKYITFSDNGCENIVIFGNTMKHVDVATSLGLSVVLGAGYINGFLSGDLKCFGDSLSLDIKSRGSEDIKIMRKQWALK